MVKWDKALAERVDLGCHCSALNRGPGANASLPHWPPLRLCNKTQTWVKWIRAREGLIWPSVSEVASPDLVAWRAWAWAYAESARWRQWPPKWKRQGRPVCCSSLWGLLHMLEGPLAGCKGLPIGQYCCPRDLAFSRWTLGEPIPKPQRLLEVCFPDTGCC